MKEFWNERYNAEEYAYGTTPNVFFKQVLDEHNLSGKILLPAEGEGRNAVYAAKKGLEVLAFDISDAGKKKAMYLAQQQGVHITYEVGGLHELEMHHEQFDVAALIYAHFPPNLLAEYHKKIGDLIKPNGMVILEGFSKNNLPLREANPQVGGPANVEMLFSVDQIAQDFTDFEPLQLEEVEVELNEGKYHNGTGKVIRFVGRKDK